MELVGHRERRVFSDSVFGVQQERIRRFLTAQREDSMKDREYFEVKLARVLRNSGSGAVGLKRRKPGWCPVFA
jgi:hypothetical protein